MASLCEPKRGRNAVDAVRETPHASPAIVVFGSRLLVKCRSYRCPPGLFVTTTGRKRKKPPGPTLGTSVHQRPSCCKVVEFESCGSSHTSRVVKSSPAPPDAQNKYATPHSSVCPQLVDFRLQFKEGRMHGEGVYTWPNIQQCYAGQWKDGIRHGHGRHYFRSSSPDGGNNPAMATGGDYYEGEWNEGVMHGEGCYVDVAGQKHEGNWVDGVCPEVNITSLFYWQRTYSKPRLQMRHEKRIPSLLLERLLGIFWRGAPAGFTTSMLPETAHEILASKTPPRTQTSRVPAQQLPVDGSLVVWLIS